MSKFKKILQAATLGLAFSSPTQLNQNEQQIPPTLKEQRISAEKREKLDQAAPSQSLKPQARADTIINNTLEEFLSYLAWIDTTGKISSNQLGKGQLNSLREIMNKINSKSEKNLTQAEKDLRMYYNRYKYSLEKEQLLIRINKILKVESPNVAKLGNLQTLVNRATQQYEIRKERTENIISATFHPNEKDPQLNKFILNNINNPREISGGTITSIHESYYKFLVGLLLVENNFGNTTTSSANAQGKFQIKPDTQQFVIDSISNLSTKVKEDPDSLGFLHLFQLAKLFGIDITKKPTREEIVLLSYLYFQGPESYSNLYDLNDETLNKIRAYCYNILLMIENDLITISQDIRNKKNT